MVRTAPRAELLSDPAIVPDGDIWIESDTAVMSGNELLYVYRTGNGILPYASLPESGPSQAPSECFPDRPDVQRCPTPCDSIAFLSAQAIVVCLDGANKTDAVRDIICTPCPECDPLTITINGVEYKEIEDPCGGIVAVRVRDADDNAVGSLDGTTWRIPSVTVQLKDSANNNIGSADIYLPGANTTKTAPDATVQLKDSAGVNIGSADSYRSNSSNNKTAPDGTVTINNSVPTTLHTVAVKSNGSATQAIADSTITKPDGTTVGLPATVALDVRDYRSGIVYSFGRLLWSGQSTQYRAGDEGALYAAGWFDYTRPVYPASYAELGADFYTLASNNIHGNTLRFTDRSGAAAATSGNRVIQDHLTGLEWYRPSSMPSGVNWNSAIDAAVASTVESSTDWWIPPFEALYSIADSSLSDVFNHTGFLITTALWTSTTVAFSTTSAIRILGANASGPSIGVLKTSTNPYLYCRRFI